MAQLYSVRDRQSWGIGDYRTISVLGRQFPEAEFLLLNPMHAAEPEPPVEDSPYLPTSRRFSNPLYIHVEDTPEFAQHPELHSAIATIAEPLKRRNRSPGKLDRNACLQAKLSALEMLWELGLTEDRARAFEDFCRHEGPGLRDFSKWCSHEGSRPAEFYAWLQFLCWEQEQHAQDELLTSMRIGVLSDLAVGVHPQGADAHNLANVLATSVSVGAPPDGYNQQGQNWSQPPWHPRKLSEAGYRPWRDMLRSILRSAGGIRIDHILGLFRLWWIPEGHSPVDGAYVTYDHEALIGALVLEASRAQAVVIGEDLGTFEPWVQEYLEERGILGTSVLWFESEGKAPKSPEKYRAMCLSSVNTHDLPPTATYLQGGHIALREKLGVLTADPVAEYAEDAAWQTKVFQQLVDSGAATPKLAEYVNSGRARQELAEPKSGRGHRPALQELMLSLHRFLSLTPSALRCVTLVDMVGELQAQNQPGTTHEVYPNWCLPLCDGEGNAVLADDVGSDDNAQEILRALR